MYGKFRFPWTSCEWRQQIPSKSCQHSTNLNVVTARISVVEGDLFFPRASSPVTETSRPPIHWVTAVPFIFPVVKQPAREADRSPSPSIVFEKD